MEESRLPSVHDIATRGSKALFLNSNLTASRRRLTTNCRISLSKSSLADFEQIVAWTLIGLLTAEGEKAPALT
jgi:hypothetical protein